MLYWSLVFFIVAIVAAIFGFGGISGTAAGVAEVLFYVAVALFVVSVVSGLLSGRRR